jgi:VIT1/CCC1 family predicted Fe2+/Mn2+ transporter
MTSVAGLMAGAMSMAAGEFVSVHSQRDTEHADLERERAELAQDPAAEQRELAGIDVSRGLAPPLADQVSAALMAWVAVSSLAFLAALGTVSARVGGAPVWNGTWRVAFWGAAAMAVTAGTGALFGVAA